MCACEFFFVCSGFVLVCGFVCAGICVAVTLSVNSPYLWIRISTTMPLHACSQRHTHIYMYIHMVYMYIYICVYMYVCVFSKAQEKREKKVMLLKRLLKKQSIQWRSKIVSKG